MRLKDGTYGAFRVVHLDNLRVYLRRRAMHAANFAPDDGLEWRATHALEIQARRSAREVPAGPGGTMLDYLPFHLGVRNLFLYNLASGRVPGYLDGQEPLVTLAVSVQEVLDAGHHAVFYDGHALNALSTCHDDPAALATFDWDAIDGTQFSDRDPDRKRRKQAEFMVYDAVPWQLVRGIGVCNSSAASRVISMMEEFPVELRKQTAVTPAWYFGGEK